MIKGIIFDADGTLLDSMPIWHDAGRIYLEKRGLEASPALVDKIFTMTLREGCAYIKELYGLPDTLEEIQDDILTEIRDFYYYEAPLKPGVCEFLKELHERRIPMVIATAGVRETLEAALLRLGVRDFFDELFFCSEFETSKREPFIYLHAAEHLCAVPSEICVFEDALYAVRTAKSAGFHVIGVADAEQSGERDEIVKTADLFILDFLDKDRLITELKI